MANSLTNLTNTILAQMALEAFLKRIAPIAAFANNFSAEAVQRGDKVKVMYVSAQDAATDFAGSYVMQDADAEGLDITINKRKYVSWSLSTEELATMPQLSLERFARQKGNALARAVLTDIWSVVTGANYGSTAYSQGAGGDVITVAASSFDSEDVAHILEMCDTADWPDERALILSPAYHAAFMSDADVIGTLGVHNGGPIATGRVPNIMGFDVYQSNVIPGNSENLVGFAAHPDAILIANRALVPESMANSPNTQVLTDPNGSGLTIVMREWFDPDGDAAKRVLECNYGYRVGNAKAIKRIVSS